MKHYIEIQRLRTQDVVVDDTLTLEKNTDAFIQGDIISITEKIDGANSSIYYDKKLDRLRCFSSKNELDFSNQLRGFLIYVKITNGIYLVCMIQFQADGSHRILLKNLLKNMIFFIRMNYTMDHL